MAARLAEIYPALANRLPRKRKTWTPEEARMNIFDALGIAAAKVERVPPEPQGLRAAHGGGVGHPARQRGDGEVISG